ncbi:MAG TPA: hypothetical protein VL551_01525 [Actinospica sp.]|nr:hypothetical protein [Actinospica sp.]
MDHLPLTRSAPFEDFPADGVIETLFPELPPPGMRPVEVTVTLPEGRCAMHIVVAQADGAEAFGMAFRACADVEDFEITARRFRG